MSTFLIIDQDENRSADICSFFRSVGHSLYEAPDYQRAITQLEKHDWDVVVSSVSIPNGTIHDLIQAVKRKDPSTVVIVHADLETTQEGLKAVQEGAFSIVQKPFSIPELSFQFKRDLEMLV